MPDNTSGSAKIKHNGFFAGAPNLQAFPTPSIIWTLSAWGERWLQEAANFLTVQPQRLKNIILCVEKDNLQNHPIFGMIFAFALIRFRNNKQN